jgi:hypothetical protein
MSYAASIIRVKPLVRASGPVPVDRWICPVKECFQGLANNDSNTFDLSILLEMRGPVTGGYRPDTERFRRTVSTDGKHGVPDETWFAELYERRYPAVLAYGVRRVDNATRSPALPVQRAG